MRSDNRSTQQISTQCRAAMDNSGRKQRAKKRGRFRRKLIMGGFAMSASSSAKPALPNPPLEPLPSSESDWRSFQIKHRRRKPSPEHHAPIPLSSRDVLLMAGIFGFMIILGLLFVGVLYVLAMEPKIDT
jgi:hypothetical protein